MDSLCDNPRWCARYDHRHCCVGGEIIDHHNGDFSLCIECGDDLFILCPACAALNPKCSECRKAVAA